MFMIQFGLTVRCPRMHGRLSRARGRRPLLGALEQGQGAHPSDGVEGEGVARAGVGQDVQGGAEAAAVGRRSVIISFICCQMEGIL